MKQTNLLWIVPVAVAMLVLLGSAYVRLTADAEPVARSPSSDPTGISAEDLRPLSDRPVPLDLPAAESLTQWTRSVESGRSTWVLRWRSDASQAARILAYLSAHSQTRVMDFSLTAGPGDEWTIEATLRNEPDTDTGSAVSVTDSQAEAALAQLLRGSETDRSEKVDSESLGDSPILDILNGGTGSVRFHDGVTYQWVRDHDVLHLELSP
ncbi:MAG: hypothetical protein R6U25_12135 [Alkalispirochaeta sp.]